MSNSLVVKSNSLIQASYSLDLVEQRIILLAIAEAREANKTITEKDTVSIHASSYIKHFEVDKSSSYKVLKDACKSLFNRYVTYHDINPDTGNERVFHFRWVDKIGYEEKSGVIFLRFSQDVIPLITELENNFTRYELSQISKLTSSYAIRLYELLIKWRKWHLTEKKAIPEFELQEFRKQIGVNSNEYKMMGDFKKRVLDMALKQVNENTDIVASYEQSKRGRIITGFKFSFESKAGKSPKIKEIEPIDEHTPDMFTGIAAKEIKPMSDAQRTTFGAKLSRHHAMEKYAGQGEGYKEFGERLTLQLSDLAKLKEYMPILIELGYKNN